MGGKRWSTEHTEYLMRNYVDTSIPMEEIQRVLGRSQPAISRVANSLGLYRVGKGYVKHFPNPFSIADASSMWVLGLWFTDGHVTSKEALITQKDRSVLDKAREIVGRNGHIERVRIFPYHGKSDAWVLKVSSVEMVGYLGEYGITRRKSRSMVFPEFTSSLLLPHFVRGLWDGDGYIKRGIDGRLVINYCTGSVNFIESLRTVLSRTLGVELNIYKQKRKHCFFIQTSGEKAEALCEWMYRGSTDENRMSRKYEAYAVRYTAYA